MDKTELTRLSKGPIDSLIDGALSGIRESDRNVRVLAVRLLGVVGLANDLKDDQRERIANGILLALGDEKRRVREVAIKSSASVIQVPEIAQQLKDIIESPDEKRRNRTGALMMLFSGNVVPVDIVRELAKTPALRPRLFLFLLGAALSPSAEELLEDFVREGDAEEARAAQRALNGEQVLNLAWFRKEERKTVKRTYDAWQGVWIWVNRSAA